MAVTFGVDMTLWTGSNVQAANRAFDDFADNILPNLDSQITLTSLTLYIGNGTDTSGAVESTRTARPGLVSMASQSMNNAVLVRKGTASLGRRGKGRMFLPGAAPDNQVSEGGIVDGTIINDINATLATWITDSNAEDAGGFGRLPLAVNGLSAGGAPGVGEPYFWRIETLVAQAKIGTQRRRIR